MDGASHLRATFFKVALNDFESSYMSSYKFIMMLSLTESSLINFVFH